MADRGVESDLFQSLPLANKCRVCSSLNNSNGSSLKRIYDSPENYAAGIFSITGVKIVECLQLPALICDGCLDDLKTAVYFRTRCREADETFKSFLWDRYEEENWSFNLRELRRNLEEGANDFSEVSCKVEVEEFQTWDPDFGAFEADDFIDDEHLDTKAEIGETAQPSKDPAQKSTTCQICFSVLSCVKNLNRHVKQVHYRDFSKRIRRTKSKSKLKSTDKLPVIKTELPMDELESPINQLELSMDESELPTAERENNPSAKKQFPSDRPKIVKCETCHKILSSQRTLNRHIKQVHNRDYSTRNQTDEPEAEITCETCGKVCLGKRKFALHKRWHDLKPEREQRNHGPCSICGGFFKSREYLRVHERTHLLKSAEDFWYCDLCGHRFRNRSLLFAHIRARHVEKIRFYCRDCPERSFASKYSLKAHIDFHHLNIRNHKCDVCNKAFPRNSKLLIHKRIHTGEQPYSCKFCDKRFVHQSDHIRHEWAHTGKRNYYCKMCRRKCETKEELESHNCPWKY